MTPSPSHTVLAIGALYAGTPRGLTADILAGHALGVEVLPVCTALVMASHGRVTDVTDVPADTVAAQLEHLAVTVKPSGIKAGVLAGHKTVQTVMDVAQGLGVPFVLDVVASGPSGETVLTARGADAIAERLAVPSLVTLSKEDAEFMTNGEIQSLDDAQVAAQRIVARGARRVLIRCGALPYRFYDAADDPGDPAAAGGDGGPSRFYADLYYDGEDFALFEAPLLGPETPAGASSALAMAILVALLRGESIEEALQGAKRYATDAIRHARTGRQGPVLSYREHRDA